MRFSSLIKAFDWVIAFAEGPVSVLVDDTEYCYDDRNHRYAVSAPRTRRYTALFGGERDQRKVYGRLQNCGFSRAL